MNQLAATGVDPDAVNAVELGEADRGTRAHSARGLRRGARAKRRPGFSAERYLGEAAISDAAELDPVIDAILAANEAQVATYRAGKEGLLGFLVGQVMKETEGKAEPEGRQRAPAREARVVSTPEVSRPRFHESYGIWAADEGRPARLGAGPRRGSNAPTTTGSRPAVRVRPTACRARLGPLERRRLLLLERARLPQGV